MIPAQGSLLSSSSRCARNPERRGGVSYIGSSVPGTPDVFVPLVQGDAEGSLEEGFDGSVLSNSALVAGNVSVSESIPFVLPPH